MLSDKILILLDVQINNLLFFLLKKPVKINHSLIVKLLVCQKMEEF